MTPEWQERILHTLGIIWRALLVVLIVIATFLVLRYTVPLIYPFIFAWLIALMIEPLVRFLEHKWRIPRWGGTTLSLLLVLGALSALVTLIIIRIVNELTRFVEFIQNNIDRISQSVTDWFVSRGTAFTQLEATIQSSLEQLEKFTRTNQSGEIADSLQNSSPKLLPVLLPGLLLAWANSSAIHRSSLLYWSSSFWAVSLLAKTGTVCTKEPLISFHPLSGTAVVSC